MQQRKLRDHEIEQLEKRGCSSDSWDLVTVADTFSAQWCKEVTFSGKISIGELGQKLDDKVVPHYASISYALIHNCSIGEGVYIKGVRNHIANYDIEEYVWIENINTLEVTGSSSFGNGVVVNVLQEQGGRAVTIYNALSAQVAYMHAFYRNQPTLITTLETLAQKEVAVARQSRGSIGRYSNILNTAVISNVQISEYSDIHNSQRLKNGTLQGTQASPVIIGTGVIADDFIIGSNSQLKDQAIISGCFIGSGCILSRGFSAENSLFFANFIGSHGEVFSIFAGPHTVTHHRATLLIGAYFSFLNAGSGSNQSNNLYKLGPLHQGIIERGSKTASDSYILWPARVGVFTLITGRHTHHCDTSKLPYSYLIEQDNESLCIPGVNLKSVGTIRDADKWPRRDRRGENSCDIINYNLLSPYTVGKMEQGIEVLETLIANQRRSNEDYLYNGVVIPSAAAEKGVTYYTIGVIKFLGNTLVKRILLEQDRSLEQLRQRLSSSSSVGDENWVDMSGFLAPRSEVSKLTASIEVQKFTTSQEVTQQLSTLDDQYDEWVWNWCAPRIEKRIGCNFSDMSKETLNAFLQQWIEVTETLDTFFEEDALKEFNKRSRIGFGLDGDSKEQEADFRAVRGVPEDNPFMGSVLKHLSNKRALLAKVESRIEAL